MLAQIVSPNIKIVCIMFKKLFFTRFLDSKTIVSIFYINFKKYLSNTKAVKDFINQKEKILIFNCHKI